MNYLVVIKTTEGSELFNFTSDEDRQEFINECKKMDSYQDYANSNTGEQFWIINQCDNFENAQGEHIKNKTRSNNEEQ